MFAKLIKSKSTYIILSLYVVFFLWWISIYSRGIKETIENYQFGFIYALIALVGGINGMVISRKWGGLKSLIGKGIFFFSLGLIGLWFGQTVWSYYNLIVKVEVPYPSLADIGFFSIIPLYSLGMYNFARASGGNFTLRKVNNKLTVIMLPLVAVGIAYYFFVKNVSPDLSNPLKTFFDFGYPLGESIPLTMAIITYFLSSRLLGGKMKGKIISLIVALLFHSVTEYAFIYTSGAGLYYNAGPVDLMYMTSFTLTSLALISFSNYD